MDRWEHFAHGADVGVRGLGHSLAAAFEQAALAMTATVSDPERIEPGEAVEVVCTAPDKGATYTSLHVGRSAEGEWIAQCVVDV